MRYISLTICTLLYFFLFHFTPSIYPFGRISSEYPQHGPWGEKIISPGVMLDYAFSPDGKYFVTSSVLGVYLWNIETGRIIRTFESDEYIFSAVGFTPDSKQILTGSWNKTVKLWDVSSGQHIQTYDKHPEHISAVAAMPNGKSFLSGDDGGTIRYIDLVTGELIQEYNTRIKPLQIIPDPKGIYFYTNNNSVYRYDLITGERYDTFFDDNPSKSIFISSDGNYIASNSSNDKLSVWNTSTFEIVFIINKFKGSFALSPNAEFLLTSNQDHANLWHVKTGELIHTFSDQNRWLGQPVFSNDGKTAYFTNLTSQYIFETESGLLIGHYLLHPHYLNSFLITPDDQNILISDHSTRPKLFSIKNSLGILELIGHKSNTAIHDVFSNGRHAITSGNYQDPTIKLWDIHSGDLIATHNSNSNSIRFINTSSDGQWGISKGTSFSDEVKIWDLFNGIIQNKINALSGLFLPRSNNYIISEYIPNSIFKYKNSIWNLETNTIIKEFKYSKNISYQSKFINEHLLLNPEMKKISGWNLLSDEELFEVPTTSYIFDFNSNKQILATIVNQPNITIWDMQDFKILGKLPGHWNTTNKIQFSSNGTHLYTTGRTDNTIREWDISALVKNRTETPVETPLPNQHKYSWLVLDGFGGIHSTDDSIPIPKLPYFYNFNIVRDIEPDPMGEGWYMLDGYGGIHSSPPNLPKPQNLPYLIGLDFARNLEIKEIGGKRYFYLLDFYGVVFSDDPNFERGNLPWFGEDRARDLEPSPYDDGWMVLDDNGNVYFSHQQWSEIPLNEVKQNTKAMTRFPNDTSVLIDGYGGRFTNPIFPAEDVINGLSDDFHFPGFDIIWDVEAIPIAATQ